MVETTNAANGTPIAYCTLCGQVRIKTQDAEDTTAYDLFIERHILDDCEEA